MEPVTGRSIVGICKRLEENKKKMLQEVMRFKCRFTYPAVDRKLKLLTEEEDWMGFSENGSDPIRSFYSYVKMGFIEKDEDEVVIYMDI